MKDIYKIILTIIICVVIILVGLYLYNDINSSVEIVENTTVAL